MKIAVPPGLEKANPGEAPLEGVGPRIAGIGNTQLTIVVMIAVHMTAAQLIAGRMIAEHWVVGHMTAEPQITLKVPGQMLIALGTRVKPMTAEP